VSVPEGRRGIEPDRDADADADPDLDRDRDALLR
jgi:hypothetical protein